MRRSSVQMPALLLMLTAPTPVRRRASPWLLVAVALVCLVLYSLYNSLQLASRESERCAHRAFVSRLGLHSTYLRPNHSSQCQVHDFLESLHQYEDLEPFYLCQRVLYNRVPKCASRTVLSTFKLIAREKLFHLVSDPQRMSVFYMNELQEKEFVANFTNRSEPLLYSRHILYINFTRYDTTPPVYINVIRDPLDRVVSHFYYNKYGDNNKITVNSSMPNMTLDECVQDESRPCFRIDRMLAFFCGSDTPCKRHNDNLLSIAKRNVKRDFLAVGLMEDLGGFMELLEGLMPHFFANATAVFQEIESQKKHGYQTLYKPALRPDTERRLRRMLAQEYDFYAFVQQRFYTLLRKVRSAKHKLFRIKAS